MNGDLFQLIVLAGVGVLAAVVCKPYSRFWYAVCLGVGAAAAFSVTLSLAADYGLLH